MFVLTGCGSASTGEGEGERGTTSPTATSSSPAAASSAPAATVEQYASIIAKERAGISESTNQLKPCAIDPTPLCGASLLTMSLRAKTLEIELEGASVDGPNNSLYIGPPPTEIADLVADTRAAAQDVQAKAEAFDACKHGCGDEFAQAYFASDDLKDQVAAWEPYL